MYTSTSSLSSWGAHAPLSGGRGVQAQSLLKVHAACCTAGNCQNDAECGLAESMSGLLDRAASREKFPGKERGVRSKGACRGRISLYLAKQRAALFQTDSECHRTTSRHIVPQLIDKLHAQNLFLARFRPLCANTHNLAYSWIEARRPDGGRIRPLLQALAVDTNLEV